MKYKRAALHAIANAKLRVDEMVDMYYPQLHEVNSFVHVNKKHTHNLLHSLLNNIEEAVLETKKEGEYYNYSETGMLHVSVSSFDCAGQAHAEVRVFITEHEEWGI